MNAEIYCYAKSQEKWIFRGYGKLSDRYDQTFDKSIIGFGLKHTLGSKKHYAIGTIVKKIFSLHNQR